MGLRYKREELIGQPIRMIHPEIKQKEITEIILEIVPGRKNNYSISLITKDGEQIPVETRVVM